MSDDCFPFIETCRRQLLGDDQSEENSNTCPGGGMQYFRALSSTGEVSVSDAVVCTAGASTLVFDVGYIGADGSFVPTALSAMSVSVIVSSGKSAVIQLLSANATKELTFAPLSTLVYVRFLDNGRNVRLLDGCCLN
jgi:hypothetical protein